MSNIAQNTPEWLEMRKNKIGASDAPVIMNEKHFGQTPYKLWQEKLNLIPSKYDTAAMERGRNLEGPARLELEKMTGHSFVPQVKYHSTIPWMIASLDGIDASGTHMAEIKCPGFETHQIALSGQVPEKYFPQLQHQLEVCELEMGYYFSFDGFSGVVVEVYRDDAYIKKMLQKEKEFWECLQELKPPPMTDRDYESKEDENWMLAAQEWLQINNQIKSLESRQKQIRDNLIKMCNGHSSRGFGIKISHTFRDGLIDYKAIPEIKSVNLEKYRKKPIEVYTILSDK